MGLNKSARCPKRTKPEHTAGMLNADSTSSGWVLLGWKERGALFDRVSVGMRSQMFQIPCGPLMANNINSAGVAM